MKHGVPNGSMFGVHVLSLNFANRMGHNVQSGPQVQFSQSTPARKCATVATKTNVRGGASQHGKRIGAPF